MTFVMATHNRDKLREMRRILEPLGIEAVTRDLPEVEETGVTFRENAYLKAKSACEATGMPAVADDSGIMVDALHGAPGVYSARFAGEDATDEDRNNKLLELLQDVPPEKRTARYVCAVCCVFPNGKTIEAEGTCEGAIGYAPRGTGGFGYDPIFYVGSRTYGEYTAGEKDAVSHRGKAMRAFAKKLEEEGITDADQ